MERAAGARSRRRWGRVQGLYYCTTTVPLTCTVHVYSDGSIHFGGTGRGSLPGGYCTAATAQGPQVYLRRYSVALVTNAEV
jgi:hypothetical protein